MVEAVFKDPIVIAFCLLRNTLDHALAHLEETIKLEAFTFSNVRVMIGGLDHKKQIEILITLSIVFQFI